MNRFSGTVLVGLVLLAACAFVFALNPMNVPVIILVIAITFVDVPGV